MNKPAHLPLLSVVTVTRNDADGLRNTLASLRRQSIDWSNVEHLVIDGGSTDDTAEVFKELATPRSEFWSEHDRGIYDAMNKGLHLSGGRYVQFLNSGDAFATDDSLALICSALDAGPEWLVARAVDEHGGHRPATLIANIPHSWWRHALGLQPHCHQTTIISRDLLQVLGGHEERFGFSADFDVIMRIGLIAEPHVLDETIVRYEGGGMSAQRQQEIPRAIARIRAERLGLTGPAARLNDAWAFYQETRIRVGRRLGR